MKLRFTLAMAVAALFGCETHDLLRYKADFPKESIKACLTENPDLSAEVCTLKPCLTDRFALNAMFTMLKDVKAAFAASELGDKWWLDAGTLLGAYRFNSIMPWDDDLDVGILSVDFEPKADDMRRNLEQRGYELVPSYGTFSASMTNNLGWWKVVFSQEKYKQVLLELRSKYNRSDFALSFNELDTILHTYLLNDKIPHLDIFLIDRQPNGMYNLHTEIWRERFPEGWNEDDIFPLNQNAPLFMGETFPWPNSVQSYLAGHYRANALQTDFVIQSTHNPICATKVRFADITKVPSLISYFKDYLRDVFPQSPIHFADRLEFAQ
jgi:hypothetical protein